MMSAPRVTHQRVPAEVPAGIANQVGGLLWETEAYEEGSTAGVPAAV
jgi:hypothetical protein